MNNSRRQEITKIIGSLGALSKKLEFDLITIRTRIESIKDDENESIESLRDFPQFEAKADEAEMNNLVPLEASLDSVDELIESSAELISQIQGELTDSKC